MQTISKEELNKMNHETKEDFVLINVLPNEAFKKAHIRTSINIPFENRNFTGLTEKIAGSKDRKIVVYCGGFNCDASTRAARKLEDAGFSNVYDYEGGTEDWHDNH